MPKAFRYTNDYFANPSTNSPANSPANSLANSLKDTLHPHYIQDFDNLNSQTLDYNDSNDGSADLVIGKPVIEKTAIEKADNVNESSTDDDSKINNNNLNNNNINNSDKILLGLDYGIKKMGMATGNSLTKNAQPFDILAMNNGQPADWDNLIGIIITWQFSDIIVGHPVNMDGSDSILAKRAHKFARRLAHRLIQLKLPVIVKLFDERLTSIEARKLAWDLGLIKHERDPIDDISACLLLTSYLNNPEYAQEIATSND